MAEEYDVVCRVISQKGTCGLGHKPGDEWTIGNKTPEGICMSAFAVIFPDARTLRFGGTFPWSRTDPDVSTVVCPDSKNPVIFELSRVKKQIFKP